MSDLDERPIARPGHEITKADYDMIIKLAPIAHASGRYGTSSPDDAAMIMFEGCTIGFNYVASLKHIRFFQGRSQLSAEGVMALVHTSQLVDLTIFQTTFDRDGIATQTTVGLQRRDSGFGVERTFTVEMARRAQLMKPDSNWAKWLQNMLEWRAFTWVARIVIPDLTSGLIPYFELQTRGTPPPQITVVEAAGQQIATVKQLPETCDHFAMLVSDVSCPSCGWPNPHVQVVDTAHVIP